MRMRYLMVCGLVFATTACSTGHFSLYIEPSPALRRSGEVLQEQAKDASWDEEYAVQVVNHVDRPPAGITVKDGRYSVAPGYGETITYLGQIDSHHGGSRMKALAMSVFLFYDLHDSAFFGLDAYCKVTFPLRTLTLGVWALMPWSWPCWADYPTDGATNARLHTQELKRAAHVMGGNLVLIQRWHSVNVTYVNQWGSATGGDRMTNAGVRAHVFLIRAPERVD